MQVEQRYDAVVVGGGHAGVEAASALSRLGLKALLVTQDARRIGWMSCNPSVGGVGKGHVVREIDAFGGVMPRLTDLTGIQFRSLNTSKGPAVQATRVQVDMLRYAAAVQEELANLPGLTIAEDEVSALEVDGGALTGLTLASGRRVFAPAVVLCTGTFLRGRIFIGLDSHAAGRISEAPADRLSASLKEHAGFRLIRLKTGTPPRLDASSIDFSRTEPQPGDSPAPFFHWASTRTSLPQLPCHMTNTTEATHDIIRAAVDQSPLFTGLISGIGPRYCPSIEDKVLRFPHHATHQIFLEPTGLDSGEVYPAGLSSSLPAAVQEAFVRTLPGLEQVRILQHAYGIEYDAVDARCLLPTLRSREVRGLYCAGQINGTSGYEEAAGQGLLAGINAGLYVKGQEELQLSRAQSYIGVMVDDLTSIGTDEPYRLFTSRAEHRLLLREGNAEERLGELAAGLGLLSEPHRAYLDGRREALESARGLLGSTRVRLGACNHISEKSSTKSDNETITLQELLCRPEVSVGQLLSLEESCDVRMLVEAPRLACELAATVKYAGYILRETVQAEKLKKADATLIPEWLDFRKVAALTREVAEKLSRLRPRTIGAASRIPGVTPAALAGILVFMQKGRGERREELPNLATPAACRPCKPRQGSDR